MKQLLAFSKKEWKENWRTGRLLLLLSLTIIFGIMNTLIAKLTPYIVQSMSENLAASGMKIGEVNVDALTSWGQFYKNMPMFLLLFLLLFSSTLTNEYQKGTLINLLTKGMVRWKIYFTKWIMGQFFWAVGFWGCSFITYFYTAIYWDNELVIQLGTRSFYYYLWGVWLYTLFLWLSSFISSGYFVLACGGFCVAGCYLLSMFTKVAEYSPFYLTTVSNALGERIDSSNYSFSLVVTGLMIAAFLVTGILFFNKKES